jgi:hypothetical protein
VTKSDREIMEILEAFDATGGAHSAAQLVGGDPKTVRRYVAVVPTAAIAGCSTGERRVRDANGKREPPSCGRTFVMINPCVGTISSLSGLLAVPR